MTMKRKPVAFGDLRGWIDTLRAQGELHEINAQVDWNIELGTIMRLAQGPGTGPALLFNNIKDYNLPTSRCRRIFGSALNNNRRIAMMLGLPPDTHARELVKIGRNILTETIAPTRSEDARKVPRRSSSTSTPSCAAPSSPKLSRLKRRPCTISHPAPIKT